MKVSGSTAGISGHGLPVAGGGDTPLPGSFVCCEVANLGSRFSSARFTFVRGMGVINAAGESLNVVRSGRASP